MKKGEAVFLPPSASSYDQLKNRTVKTLLEESNVHVTIDGAYPYHLFSAYSIATNAIVLNDADYELVFERGFTKGISHFHYYAFNVPDWQKTKEIGLSIDAKVSESFLAGGPDDLPYSFENPGLNYSVIRTTFSLLLFIGLLTGSRIFPGSRKFHLLQTVYIA